MLVKDIKQISLFKLEKQAAGSGLLLRLQVRRPLNLWALRLVVAQQLGDEKIQILGEMKAWAYKTTKGLQLDTMQVHPKARPGVGDLVWAATMAWALEETPCEQARLLAIDDAENQHFRLVRYFRLRGFRSIRQVGLSLGDLPLRTIWGGQGVLMAAKCEEVLELSYLRWQASL